ncbi:MAG: NAD(+)/NADH kinase [Candidatus Kapabacteria bacterium]|jgi:NAD+ kinase|nr:NAD(+)/NADH kinase [Candidatus Kapabacteria bacterium]
MKHLGLFVNTTKPDAISCTEMATRIAFENGMRCCAAPEVVAHFAPETQALVDAVEYDNFDKHADIIISFGGDGTILAAAKQFLAAELPIMGVNLGRLGFLAEYSVAELDAGFAALAKGEYIIEERGMLESSITVEGTENLSEMVYAMNDFVIHKKDFARMMMIAATIDGVPVADYHADGLIISTPTGSTAYSLSSGGPIVAPTCSVLVLTPVSPHSLNMRPLVVPDTVEIVLTPGAGSGTTSLVADGQIVASKEEGEKIVIRKSERVVKLLKRVENSYYDLLKNKLLWSLLTKQ